MASSFVLSSAVSSPTLLSTKKLTGSNVCQTSRNSISAIGSRMTSGQRSSFISNPLKLSFSAPILPAKRQFAIQSKYLGDSAPPGTSNSGGPTHSHSSASTQSPDVRVKPGTAGAVSVVVAIGLPLLAGTLVSSFNKPTTDWYRSLKKPSWNPPDAIFGAVWSILYATMGYSAWLVWRNGGLDAQGGPLTTYAIQLVLNLLWPILCFGAKNLFWSLIDIVALCFAVYNTIQAFYPVDEFAAQLLWPYFIWVLFATVLNFTLWRVNRRNDRSPPGTISGTRAYSS